MQVLPTLADVLSGHLIAGLLGFHTGDNVQRIGQSRFAERVIGTWLKMVGLRHVHAIRLYAIADLLQCRSLTQQTLFGAVVGLTRLRRKDPGTIKLVRCGYRG